MNLRRFLHYVDNLWAPWLVLVLVYPFLTPLENLLFRYTEISVGEQLTYIFIYAILALGLNVVVGYTGLLHLGIAAFFGIGAYITGILRVAAYPFQFDFLPTLALSALGAALAGVCLGAPTLRLRGDYLAIVTLGFGEVTRFTLRNLEAITAGTRGLNPIPPPAIPSPLVRLLAAVGIAPDFALDYRLFYYLTLGLLLAVIWLLSNLERSRWGRACVAVREDELAAACMGVRIMKVKLSAFALSAALAGLAGSLYATTLGSTAGPDAFDFPRSITILAAIILGGLGSLRGTLLGVFLLVGFNNVLTPLVDSRVLGWTAGTDGTQSFWLTFSNWNLMVFGLALIVMMRFRPEGLLPSARIQQELHGEAGVGVESTG